MAEDGTCPNCERPYRSQPSPLNSDMAMRDMVAPGEDDMGGNPLQEGILGDYQHGQKRDESYASVHARLSDDSKEELEDDDEQLQPDIEIPAEITGVLPPDPGSIHSRLTDLYRQTHE